MVAFCLLFVELIFVDKRRGFNKAELFIADRPTKITCKYGTIVVFILLHALQKQFNRAFDYFYINTYLIKIRSVSWKFCVCKTLMHNPTTLLNCHVATIFWWRMQCEVSACLSGCRESFRKSSKKFYYRSKLYELLLKLVRDVSSSA